VTNGFLGRQRRRLDHIRLLALVDAAVAARSGDGRCVVLVGDGVRPVVNFTDILRSAVAPNIPLTKNC
jgi:hypothetical protein